MNGRITQGLAIALSALAGFVDAQGYLSLGGLFVAFMSGNSTVLGIGVASPAGGRVVLAGGLVAAFVAGVMLGTWVGHTWRTQRAPLVLAVVAAVLAGAALLHGQSLATPAVLATALAMGVENTVFAREGQSGLGLTYMTGTLVRLGQRLLEALTAHGPWSAVVPDVLLWSGMVAGAALGALVYGVFGLDGLWFAVSASLVMAGVAWAGSRPEA